MIRSQRSVDALVAHLDDGDSFLRYKVIAALTQLRGADDTLRVPAEPVERRIVAESHQVLRYLSLHHNLTSAGAVAGDSLLACALEQKQRRGQGRIFKLLAHLHPPDDIDAAEWTLANGDSRTRASAVEYLDNLLSGRVRKAVLPLIEDMTVDDRVRRANLLLGTRHRDVEDTLVQLVNDDDQVVAACAIDLVCRRGLWGLAPDLEHVLAHRDVRDWFVFEAASWALAEHRVRTDLRRRWLEPVPVVVLAAQVRRLPLFASLSVAELFRVAAGSRQVRHEPGAVLLQERAVPSELHVLLDGMVSVGNAESATSTGPPEVFGFWEALLARPMRRSVRTLDTVVTLTMTAEELRTQLASNSELVRGLFATMQPRRLHPADGQIHPTGAADQLRQIGEQGLTPVGRLLALGHVPVFSQVSAEEAVELARIAHPITLREGQPLFRASDRPATWLILSGEVRLEPTDGLPAQMAGSGDTVGWFSALAGSHVGRDATVAQPGVALRVKRDDLFELLGDRPDLMRQLFAGMMALNRPAPATQETVR